MQKRGSEYDWFYFNEQSPKVHLDKAISSERAWTVISNEATLHLGGLTFLSTCNCNSNDLNIKELPLFYERMLQYWFEFKDEQNNKMPCTKKTIIWNNKDIKIDNKIIFIRAWFDKGVYTLKDLLDPNLDSSLMKNLNSDTSCKQIFWPIME